jgi:nitrogen fixation/metabolism regulation signal transduction histidine kinase
MVKKIADEHGARIDLRNVDGGACVTLLFPRIRRARPGSDAGLDAPEQRVA